MAQALAGGSAAQRMALPQQLEDVDQRAVDGEAEGSPYLVLAAHLRALAERLAEVG